MCSPCNNQLFYSVNHKVLVLVNRTVVSELNLVGEHASQVRFYLSFGDSVPQKPSYSIHLSRFRVRHSFEDGLDAFFDPF
jgi:hypothetical protein